MFRNVFRLFIILIAALMVRQVVALIVRAFSQLTASPARPEPARPPQAGGELKKDPVCGTFVAVASSIKRTVNGEVIHFCSTTCRDNYRIA